MTTASPLTSQWWRKKTRLLNGNHPPEIEVYLRSLAPPVGVREQQESTLTQLRALRQDGHLESLNEIVWGKAVSPDGQCRESPTGRKMLDQIETFRDWAANEEPTVNIPFQETYATSELTSSPA